MEGPQLSPNEAYSLMVAFLDRMRVILGKISPQVLEKMSDIFFYVSEDPATPSNWRDCYIKTSRKPFSRKAVLSLQEAFSVMITFVALDSYELQGDHFELSVLLNSMRCYPELHKKEWSLWEEIFWELRQSGIEENVW